MKIIDTELLEKMGYEYKNISIENQFCFDKFQEDMATRIMKKINVSYGIASKILAIYLKVYAVIPYPYLYFSKLCHPPLDSFLLNKLRKKDVDIKSNIKWTIMNKENYWDIIKKIKYKFKEEIDYYGFWIIEFLWSPIK